jgi:dGTP triphosphohydrolase
MKYLIVVCLSVFQLSASIYYAKVEPKEMYSIKASVSGEVQHLYKEYEGKISNGKTLLQIDDVLDKKELMNSKTKLSALRTTLEMTQINLKNAKEIENIKTENYDRIKDLKTKSKVEKDNELINLLNAQNQVITLENSVQNLLIQISDIEYKIATLEDSIEKKNVKVAKGFLIYKTYVNKGDFVNVGASLVDAYDISKGKLTIYLSKEDVALVQTAVMYVNDAATEYKVDKIWDVVDTQNISAYKAEILIPAPKRFSELLKIEFK